MGKISSMNNSVWNARFQYHHKSRKIPVFAQKNTAAIIAKFHIFAQQLQKCLNLDNYYYCCGEGLLQKVHFAKASNIYINIMSKNVKNYAVEQTFIRVRTYRITNQSANFNNHFRLYTTTLAILIFPMHLHVNYYKQFYYWHWKVSSTKKYTTSCFDHTFNARGK